MGKTFAEKVLARKAGKDVVAGEIVEVQPDVAMSHDNTAAIAKTFYSIGVNKVFNPDIHVVILDHCVPAANEKFAQNHKEVREFVAKQGIKHFYDIHRGICHQVLPEEGFALPGELIVGSDSHSTTYGAFGAFATGIGRSEMAVIFATGKIWLRVPETMRVVVTGTLPEGISAKDVILYIIGKVTADGALYKAVEFTGPTVQAMSIASRMVLTNMAVEMGAKIGYVQPDEKTVAWLEGRARRPFQVVKSDPDAAMEEVVFDVSNLEPMVACPHTVDHVKPVREVQGVKVDQVFFGSCTNGRLEDFAEVVSLLRGKRIHPRTRMVVIPASQQVLKEALAAGYIAELVEAGAVLVNPGCGPCMGNHEGIMAPGEVTLSTSNRNFKGRFGCKDAEIYLASPRTAAATALTGTITDFRELM
ncbi:MAG: 3-isopropylmalate dehydratase large subunit [Candidatus Oleimicrobiaceae bacterium]